MCSNKPTLYVESVYAEDGTYYNVCFGQFIIFSSTSRNACKQFILKHNANIRKGNSMNIYISNRKGENND